VEIARRAAPIAVGVLIGLLAAGLLGLLIVEPRGEAIRLLPPPSPAPLRVHVSGAVAHPGVYSLPRGSIVQQAIEAAGGALTDADLDRVNLAAPVDDGQQVRVPFVTQPPPEGATAVLPGPDPPATGLVNINTATAPELELLPGIGPSLAQSIVAYREAHGLFREVEDLLDVPGIGPAKLEQIRALVTVE
jgi:competence protein ComEA